MVQFLPHIVQFYMVYVSVYHMEKLLKMSLTIQSGVHTACVEIRRRMTYADVVDVHSRPRMTLQNADPNYMLISSGGESRIMLTLSSWRIIRLHYQ